MPGAYKLEQPLQTQVTATAQVRVWSELQKNENVVAGQKGLPR